MSPFFFFFLVLSFPFLSHQTLESSFSQFCTELSKQDPLSIPHIMFEICSFHKLGFSGTSYAAMAKQSYTHGSDQPPLQMSLEQYLQIALTLYEIPSPRLLFFGCGQDTAAFFSLVKFLGGSAVFVDGTLEVHILNLFDFF